MRLSDRWHKKSRVAQSSLILVKKNRCNNNEYRIALTRLMREKRYQQHGAQPSSSMILHAGCFSEWCRPALFSLSPANNDDDDDDETDLVVPHSRRFYWQLLTTASRHWTTSVNDIHVTVILSSANRATRSSSRDISHVGSDKVCHLPRSDNRRLSIDYRFSSDNSPRSGPRAEISRSNVLLRQLLDTAAHNALFCRIIFLYDTPLVEYFNRQIYQCPNALITTVILLRRRIIIVLLIFFVYNMYGNSDVFFFLR